MRKLMFCLATVIGAGAFASGAGAAPREPFAFDAGRVQTVEFRPDWRAHEDWRQRRHEEWRRREAAREHDRWEHRHY